MFFLSFFPFFFKKVQIKKPHLIKSYFKFSKCSQSFATEDYLGAVLNRGTVAEFNTGFAEKVSCRLSHTVRQN